MKTLEKENKDLKEKIEYFKKENKELKNWNKDLKRKNKRYEDIIERLENYNDYEGVDSFEDIVNNENNLFCECNLIREECYECK